MIDGYTMGKSISGRLHEFIGRRGRSYRVMWNGEEWLVFTVVTSRVQGIDYCSKDVTTIWVRGRRKGPQLDHGRGHG